MWCSWDKETKTCLAHLPFVEQTDETCLTGSLLKAFVALEDDSEDLDAFCGCGWKRWHSIHRRKLEMLPRHLYARGTHCYLQQGQWRTRNDKKGFMQQNVERKKVSYICFIPHLVILYYEESFGIYIYIISSLLPTKHFMVQMETCY